MMIWKFEQMIDVSMLIPLLLLPHISEMQMLAKMRRMMRKKE